MAVEITLVRHGETEANAAGVWQGTSDSPLTENGLRQVEHLAGRFGGAPPPSGTGDLETLRSYLSKKPR